MCVGGSGSEDYRQCCFPTAPAPKGPSIYDVHTEGGGGQARMDACGRGRGVKPHVDVHTEN